MGFSTNNNLIFVMCGNNLYVNEGGYKNECKYWIVKLHI